MKTKLSFFLLFFLLPFAIINCFAQPGEWVWMHGDSIGNQPAIYGVQGVPAPTNNPPGYYEPCEWTDLNGNFWLFGGSYTSAAVYYNDLWKYNPGTNEWTWVKGPGVSNDAGNYGTQGVPSPTNNPPARAFGCATWVDNQGALWLFGGYGNGGGSLNDLWKYDISSNEWTWMKGSNINGQQGVYGTQGVDDPANVPGARYETSASWTDNAGNLWLFGGLSGGGYYNDLWKYDIVTNNWTWVKGANGASQSGVYGIMGIEDPANTPGARLPYSRWKDSAGNFWLFGGGSYFNDLWRYNIATDNWAWMAGDSITNAAGVYGIKCLADSMNVPPSRYESSAAWKDPSDNLYLFGGYNSGTMNDLWKYCITTGNWIWISGDNIIDPAGQWGIMGVSSPFNKPNGRRGSAAWTDNNGHLYFYGGYGVVAPAYCNDLWKYTIDTACGVCPPTTSVQELTNTSPGIEIYPNPTNNYCEIRILNCGLIDNAYLSITNTVGETIYQKQLSISSFQFSTASFADGIYIVEVNTLKGIFQKKLVVNH